MLQLLHAIRSRARTGLALLSLAPLALMLAPAHAQLADELDTLQEDTGVPVLDLRPEDTPDSCDPQSSQIRTTVNGVAAHGLLTVELYRDDRRNFLSKEGRMRRVRVAAVDGAQTVCINIPGPGTYAIAAYHDEDGDRKLDRKWTRLPKEPFALSNNPKLKLRKPRLREAAFQAGAFGANIDLYLRSSRPDR